MNIDKKYLLERREVSIEGLKSAVDNHGYVWTGQMLLKSFAEGKLRPQDVPLYVVAEATGAAPILRRGDPSPYGGYISTAGLTQEEAVDVTAFANITGQIVYSMIKDGFMEADAGLFEALANVIPTQYDGEKIPQMGEILDEDFTVAPGMPFPHSGFGEHWVTTPATTKHGLIVAVTKEAVFFDRTGGRVLRQCGTVGARLATGRLKRFLRVLSGITNSYSWDGTAYNTYQTAGTLWTNSVAKTLTDYTDIDEAMQLAANMTDPDTGNPIDLIGSTLIVMPANRMTARRIVNGTTVEQGAISATVPRTMSVNPIEQGDVSQIVVSALLRNLIDAEGGVTQAQADAWWFLGDPKRAFAYMQNWGLTVVVAPPQNPDEFNKDIVAQYKASERGVPAVIEPRYMLRFTNA